MTRQTMSTSNQIVKNTQTTDDNDINSMIKLLNINNEYNNAINTEKSLLKVLNIKAQVRK